MKKTLIIAAALILCGAIYFTYEHWVKDGDLTSWSFVPENSILVYESATPLQVLDELKQTEIWKNLNYISNVSHLESGLELLDSINGDVELSTAFGANSVLISCNATGAQSFDFLYIMEVKNLSQQTFLSKAQDHFQEKGFKKRTREYNGFTITELQKNDLIFTYIFYKNFFISSYSAFLVEDAIRTVSSDLTSSFSIANPELFTLTKLEKDQGNLYVNESRIPVLLNVFSSQITDQVIAQSSFMDVKVQNKVINLNGFTLTSDQNQFLKVFNGIGSGGFETAEIIPNQASWVMHLSTQNPLLLGNNLVTYYTTHYPQIIQQQQEIQKAFDFDVNHIYNLLDEEMAIVQLESPNTGTGDQLISFKIKDMKEALIYFNSVSERQMNMSGDSLYQEKYGEYTIRRLPIRNYPKALFGDYAGEFTDCFYISFRNYLIFSNNVTQLKNFTLAHENEATWTKSVEVNNYLDLTNKESCLSFYVSIPRVWNQLLESLKPEWADFFKKNQFTFKNLKYLAVQFSPVDEKFYTNVLIYQPELPEPRIPESYKLIHTTALPDYISSKPYLVTNHANKQKEVLLQDSTNSIYLVGSDFSVLWDTQVNEQLISVPQQIDYYKNGKLQYVFATASAVHILDRNGAYLPEFPKQLPKGEKIQDFNIIDYNNTKDYRFAILSNDNQIWLTDKDVKPLDGWNPYSVDYDLLRAPIHQRLGGKDVLLILGKEGTVDLLNRRGESQKGFPIDYKLNILKDLHINSSNSLKNSTATIMLETGELVTINFLGELIHREQIYKPGVETEFTILPDVSEETYLLLRHTGNLYEVLDQNGNVLFEKEYFSRQPLSIQYYQLGAGKEYIIFVDYAGAYLYIYDLSGNLMTGSPLAASQPVSMMQFDNKFQIYRAVDRNLELISLGF